MDRIEAKIDALAESLADVRERLARLEAKAPPSPGGAVAGAGAAGAAIATLVQFLVQQFGG